jgi:hypothetical protein
VRLRNCVSSTGISTAVALRFESYRDVSTSDWLFSVELTIAPFEAAEASVESCHTCNVITGPISALTLVTSYFALTSFNVTVRDCEAEKRSETGLMLRLVMDSPCFLAALSTNG